MIRNFGTSGIESQPSGIDVGAGGSNISSMQVIQATTVINRTYTDYVIAPVDLSRSIVYVNYGKSGDSLGGSSDELQAPYFLNKNTVRMTSRTSRAPSEALRFTITVIEFNNVKSKQSGITAGGSAQPTNVAITAVNPNKCIAVSATLGSVNMNNGLYQIISTTNLSLETNLTDTTQMFYYWQVIEFK